MDMITGFINGINYIYRLEILVGIGVAVVIAYILHSLGLIQKKD